MLQVLPRVSKMRGCRSSVANSFFVLGNVFERWAQNCGTREIQQFGRVVSSSCTFVKYVVVVTVVTENKKKNQLCSSIQKLTCLSPFFFFALVPSALLAYQRLRRQLQSGKKSTDRTDQTLVKDRENRTGCVMYTKIPVAVACYGRVASRQVKLKWGKRRRPELH